MLSRMLSRRVASSRYRCVPKIASPEARKNFNTETSPCRAAGSTCRGRRALKKKKGLQKAFRSRIFLKSRFCSPGFACSTCRAVSRSPQRKNSPEARKNFNRNSTVKNLIAAPQGQIPKNPALSLVQGECPTAPQ